MPLSHDSLKELCHTVGLDLVGVAQAETPQHRDFFLSWLQAGMHGEMQYMQKRRDQRLDPSTLLPGAKSILCFAWNYYRKEMQPAEDSKPRGKVARYAQGHDYHKVFKRRLKLFWQRLLVESGREAKCRIFVDSAPIMERDFAAAAGIGWIGKNTCLIHPKLGSWLFLGEIVTDLELTPTPPMHDYCGTCTACIDACPTDALVAPYKLDSRRCISYLTIEKRSALTEKETKQIESYLFGCDICQDVCPWNNKAKEGSFFAAGFRDDLADGKLDELTTQDEMEFESKFAGTPIMRRKQQGWQQNLKAVARNLDRK